MPTIEELIGYLQIIDGLDIPDSDEFINSKMDPDLMNRIQEAACTVLIDESGKNRWDNHDLLAESGFPVFAGEKDRFGWLTGCIQTKKGIIVYD
jgi:hypothetical protein